MRRPNLDPRSLVLDYVKAYCAAHDYAPTQREIADGCGLSSVTVYRHVRFLRKLGVLEQGNHKWRNLRVKAKAS